MLVQSVALLLVAGLPPVVVVMLKGSLSAKFVAIDRAELHYVVAVIVVCS